MHQDIPEVGEEVESCCFEQSLGEGMVLQQAAEAATVHSSWEDVEEE